MISQNASLAIGFKGAAKLNGVPMFLHQLPMTAGGVIDHLETQDPAFGVLVSSFPNEPGSFRVGIPAGSIPRGVLLFDAAISQNDPGKPSSYFPGNPAAAAIFGPVQYSSWTKVATSSIDPVLGCKVIANDTTGVIEFLPAATVAAPAGYTLLNAAVIAKDFDGNGVTIFFGGDALSAAEELPVVATPVADPVAGSYAVAQSVELTCATVASTIYYTIDGSEPDETDTEYTVAIDIAATTTLKARAFATNYAPSNILTAVYTIA